MILQNLVFPKENICNEPELYFHGTTDGKIPAGNEADLFTYFNSFSAYKWKMYTTVEQVCFRLRCHGNCEITLWDTKVEDGADPAAHSFASTKHEEGGADEVVLRFSLHDVKGIVYAVIKAESDTVIFGGSFETVHEPVLPVKIAVGICTFRREEFVKKTLETLKRETMENPDSPLYQNVYVYVSDNGQTLPCEELSNDRIFVMPNRNTGGSGGFGRCMKEAYEDREKYGLTHILLMDDDIVLEPESLFRTYTLLNFLKEERKGAMLGGGLLRLDIPYIQHANGELWQGGRIGFTKRGYDLRRMTDVVRNEYNLPMDYNGWWYCCVPLAEQFRGFPLPIFIHGDDIEYGLRFDGNIMTLNGIGVWHDAFDNRKASSMEYYDMRNTLIACAIHHPGYSRLHMIKRVARHLIGQMLHLRVKDQELTMKGVEDFCKGTEFLRELDPTKLHPEIMKMGYAMQDVSDDLYKFGVDVEKTKPQPSHLYED
ncbi:MAG: glycosyltransferase, partial [Clostridium sp.]